MAVLDTTRASDAAVNLGNLFWCARSQVQLLCLNATFVAPTDRDWVKQELSKQAAEAQIFADELRDALASLTAEEGHTIVPSDQSHFKSFAAE